MARTTETNATLAKRVDDLEVRLSLVERTPALTGAIKRQHLDEKIRRQEQQATERVLAAHRKAAPQRAARFEAFTAERLEFESGLRTTAGHVALAYRAFCDEHEVPRLERFDESELTEQIAGLDGIEPCVCLSCVGGQVPAFAGVGVAEEYQSGTDPTSDERLIRQAEREAKREAAEAAEVLAATG